MTNPVIFRRGNSSEIATFVSQDSDSLLFVEDQHIIYKTTGVNKPLARYSDVQSGFADLADLEIKVTNPVHGKLYLTKNNHIYFYDDSQWKTITAESQLDEIDASKVNYDNTTSSLVSITAQDALDELDSKIETNKVKVKDIEDTLEEVEIDLDKVIADVAINTSEINIIKADLDELETNVVANTTAISTLQSADGKVKLKSTDTADYVESKLDGNTVVVKNNKIVVKGIEGVTVGSADINQLSGVKANIQNQIDILTQNISDSSGGLSYIGSFPTKIDLDSYANPENGLLAVVVDSDNEGATILYIYSESTTSWESIGQFEFASEFKDLKGTPDTYEADMFLKSDGTQLIYSKVKYSELQGKPNVSVVKIENAANTAHIHANTTVLDKFTEDTSGNILYDNQKLASESMWTAFEF